MRFLVDRKVILAVAGLLTALTLFLAGWLLLSLWEEGSLPAEESGEPAYVPEDAGELIFYDGIWYAPREDLETLLVLGLDRSDRQGIETTGDYAQSDLVLLLIFDWKKEACRIVQINRDTVTEIQDFDRYGRPNGTYTAQLTLAYAHAQAYTKNDVTACHAAVKAVSSLLYGIKIDHYVTLTMDGLMELNDLAGGVEVAIQDDFSAVDPALVQGERVTLMGRHALNFVRARWYVGENTNLERMERQREYLLGLWEKLSALSADDEEFILSSLKRVNEYMDSDCTVQQLESFAQNIRAFSVEEILTLEGEVVQGETAMKFFPDEDALKKLVIEEFYCPAEGPQDG